MAVVRKHPAPKFVCGTFGYRYNNWYKKELEEEQKLRHAKEFHNDRVRV